MTNSYENALEEGRELTAASRDFRPVLFRDELMAALFKALDARRSILLVGLPGVGKTSIVQALARHLHQDGPRKLYEFAVVQMLAGTVYLGEWQSKVTSVFDGAAKQNTLLFFSDIWNLLTAGRSASGADSVWDALRPRLLSGEVQIIGELTEEQHVALQAIPGFVTPFDVIEVTPLSEEQVASIVLAEAARIGVDLDRPTASRLLELCNHFLPVSAGPGPALQLTSQVRHYRDEKKAIGEDEPLTPAFVEKVFSVYTGLPRFVVSRQEVRPVAEVRDWFRARIIGQRDAIESVVQTLTLFKAGLHDPRRPIGSFLFVGPTGVGKTELARALATYLFGSEKRLLRFDMSEFKDYHSFELLIGDPEKPQQPARLVDPMRAQPFQVVLFDEIEKAHANVWDLLLQVLDDGRLTPARGRTVNFRHAIIIATSNVGAQALARRPVGFTGAAKADGTDRLQAELETVFRPEFLNRFQHVVRFLPLTQDEVREIARTELRRALDREGIVGRKLVVDIQDEVLDLVVRRGYDERYGARALKRQVQQQIMMPIATLLMERPVDDASIIRLSERAGEVRIAVLDSEESRTRRKEREPVRLAGGRKITRDTLLDDFKQARLNLQQVVESVNMTALKSERAALEERRQSVDLWREPRAAAVLLEQFDRIDRVIERVERLQRDEAELDSALHKALDRDHVARMADELQRFEERLAQARRELQYLGDSCGDALVEIRPIGRSRFARDLLLETYSAWAAFRQFRLRIVQEPMTDDEPATIAIHGPYAYGYLALEAGHHRVRAGRDTFVARVRIVQLSGVAGAVIYGGQKALKQRGQFGGRIRSRVEIAGTDLVIQNAGTLAENRELAEELAPSWRGLRDLTEGVVRRYDMEPFLVRDFLTATTTGRADILKPAPFHELLCARVDARWSAAS